MTVVNCVAYNLMKNFTKLEWAPDCKLAFSELKKFPRTSLTLAQVNEHTLLFLSRKFKIELSAYKLFQFFIQPPKVKLDTNLQFMLADTLET